MTAAVVTNCTTGRRGSERGSRAGRTEVRCARELADWIPATARAVWLARPRAIMEHSELGPMVRRALGVEGEAWLAARAARDGFDLRTLDRAAWLELPEGTAYIAAGTLDTDHILSRFWARLSNPRQRIREAGAFETVVGVDHGHPTVLRVDRRCGVLELVEGSTTPSFDADATRLRFDTQSDAIVSGRIVGAEAGARFVADAPLIAQVRTTRVVVRSTAHGLDVRVGLEGSFALDADSRVRAALARLVEAPIGDLSGAVRWLDPSEAVTTQGSDHVEIHALIPWRSVRALIDALIAVA